MSAGAASVSFLSVAGLAILLAPLSGSPFSAPSVPAGVFKDETGLSRNSPELGMELRDGSHFPPAKPKENESHPLGTTNNRVF
jgi:hypothetical protein